MSVYDELAQLGSATVHEAAGRSEVVDYALIQVVPGSRAAGPARTVRCGERDNLMVHAAIAEAEPGEVLVLTSPEPKPHAPAAEQPPPRNVAAVVRAGCHRSAVPSPPPSPNARQRRAIRLRPLRGYPGIRRRGCDCREAARIGCV